LAERQDGGNKIISEMKATTSKILLKGGRWVRERNAHSASEVSKLREGPNSYLSRGREERRWKKKMSPS